MGYAFGSKKSLAPKIAVNVLISRRSVQHQHSDREEATPSATCLGHFIRQSAFPEAPESFGVLLLQRILYRPQHRQAHSARGCRGGEAAQSGSSLGGREQCRGPYLCTQMSSISIYLNKRYLTRDALRCSAQGIVQ